MLSKFTLGLSVKANQAELMFDTCLFIKIG